MLYRGTKDSTEEIATLLSGCFKRLFESSMVLKGLCDHAILLVDFPREARVFICACVKVHLSVIIRGSPVVCS